MKKITKESIQELVDETFPHRDAMLRITFSDGREGDITVREDLYGDFFDEERYYAGEDAEDVMEICIAIDGSIYQVFICYPTEEGDDETHSEPFLREVVEIIRAETA